MSQPPPPPPPSLPGDGAAPRPAAPIGNPLVGYWKRVVLENYANFSGRARRAEFWWYTLANVIVFAVLGLLAQASSVFIVLEFAVGLALLIPGLAVAVRRLHDTGKSAWYLLIWLIPLVGPIVIIVFLATDSTRGTNQYGISEKYPV